MIHLLIFDIGGVVNPEGSMPVLVEGAKAVGIHGILYENCEQLKKELELVL